MHKIQTDTMRQPLWRRFSSAGILLCISRQKMKEWEGGIQCFHMAMAQSFKIGVGCKKRKASLVVNKPSAECNEINLSSKGERGKTIFATWDATVALSSTNKGTSIRRLTIAICKEQESPDWNAPGIYIVSTSEVYLTNYPSKNWSYHLFPQFHFETLSPATLRIESNA